MKAEGLNSALYDLLLNVRKTQNEKS